MNRIHPRAGKPANPAPLAAANVRTDPAETRVEQAKTRAEAAETRIEQVENRIELAKTRTERAETRTEQAETRTEQAETRTEQAETRTEQAETRTEQAETRAQLAETALDRVVHKEADQLKAIPRPLHPISYGHGTADPGHPINLLTPRQREILQLIAEGQNTKQIAGILQISPKTVEYHRMKLMTGLNVHDIPGLVRIALRVGLIPPDDLRN